MKIKSVFLIGVILFFLALIKFSTASVSNVHLISGVVFQDGTSVIATPNLLGNASSFYETNSSGSEYKLAFFSGGTKVKDFYFQPSSDPYSDPYFSGNLYFVFSVVIPPSADSIKIMRNETVIGNYSLDASIPVVSSVSVSKDAREVYNVSWNAGYVNNETEYLVYYSLNGGEWNLMGMTFDKQFSFSDVIPKGNARIMVVAYNRYNRGSAVSSSFVVSSNPLRVFIESPEYDYAISVNSSIDLSGEAYGVDSVPITLRWYSNLEGFLGSGPYISAKLSLGNHTITLYADNGERNLTDSVGVVVVNDTRPDIRVSGLDYSYDGDALYLYNNVTLSAKFHDIVSDASANVSFYDGDPNNGGTLIYKGLKFFSANEDSFARAMWTPTLLGVHSIYVVVSGSSPIESNLSNNILSEDVYVSDLCGGADFNHDGEVGPEDFGIMKDNFGAIYSCGFVDVNMDGQVSGLDFNLVKTNFGMICVINATTVSQQMGDANGDGEIGPEDFAALKDNFGRTDCIVSNPCNGGDINGDGQVSGLDFNIVKTNFGRALATHSEGDANGDGQVSGLDFNIVKTNFGMSC